MHSITFILKTTPEHVLPVHVSFRAVDGNELIEIETLSEDAPIASGTYELRRHPQDTSYGILIHTQSQQTQAFHLTKDRGLLWLWLAGQTYCIEEAKAQNKTSTTAGIFQAELKAPMPGKILQILAVENTELNAQQAVIVMESMKMELSLTVEVPCLITKILCQPNQLVEMNAVLATLSEL